MDSQEGKRLSTLDIFSLISSPSYFPTTLRHLPQPVPNDLPPDLDGSIFTFEDAFEDLLAACQGQKLPDITARYQQRRLLRDMFPIGEPNWFWLRRLESQGLIQVTRRTQFSWPHQPEERSRIWQELDQRADDAWRSASKEYGDNKAESWDPLKELGKAFRELERGSIGESTVDFDVHKDKQGSRKGPNTFEELFAEISSQFKESTSSWDTFIKAITEDAKSRSLEEVNETQSHCSNKNKVVTNEKEYVDRFGYLHRTTTRKTLDGDGNEVGSQTYVVIRPISKDLDNENKDESGGYEPLENGNDSKKSSWFWK